MYSALENSTCRWFFRVSQKKVVTTRFNKQKKEPCGMYIGTRRQFYRSSYVMPHKISDGVEERAKRENDVVASRNNHLMSETTTL
jgi:hypothetical protein